MLTNFIYYVMTMADNKCKMTLVTYIFAFYYCKEDSFGLSHTPYNRPCSTSRKYNNAIHLT